MRFSSYWNVLLFVSLLSGWSTGAAAKGKRLILTPSCRKKAAPRAPICGGRRTVWVLTDPSSLCSFVSRSKTTLTRLLVILSCWMCSQLYFGVCCVYLCTKNNKSIEGPVWQVKVMGNSKQSLALTWQNIFGPFQSYGCDPWLTNYLKTWANTVFFFTVYRKSLRFHTIISIIKIHDIFMTLLVCQRMTSEWNYPFANLMAWERASVQTCVGQFSVQHATQHTKITSHEITSFPLGSSALIAKWQQEALLNGFDGLQHCSVSLDALEKANCSGISLGKRLTMSPLFAGAALQFLDDSTQDWLHWFDVWFVVCQDKKVVPCRFDWHQTGSQVIISIYAKNSIPELSYVEGNSTTVRPCTQNGCQ